VEHKGTATLVRHCAVFGRKEKVVRYVKTGDPCPYAQHARSVTLSYLLPRKRNVTTQSPCGLPHQPTRHGWKRPMGEVSHPGENLNDH
jgi:hypothetical protein